MEIPPLSTVRSPVDTPDGDLAFEWATSALLEGMAENGDGEQMISIRGLAEEAVFEALGVHHGDAESIVTEVERRIEGLFHMVGTA